LWLIVKRVNWTAKKHKDQDIKSNWKIHKSRKSLVNTFEDHAMAQAVSCRPLNAGSRARILVSQCGTCGGKSCTNTGSTPSSSFSSFNIILPRLSTLIYHQGDSTAALNTHISPRGWTIGPLGPRFTETCSHPIDVNMNKPVIMHKTLEQKSKADQCYTHCQPVFGWSPSVERSGWNVSLHPWFNFEKFTWWTCLYVLPCFVCFVVPRSVTACSGSLKLRQSKISLPILVCPYMFFLSNRPHFDIMETLLWCEENDCYDAKVVPLYAMQALGVRGVIAPTHSRPRH
jgi:hypothetical protein